MDHTQDNNDELKNLLSQSEDPLQPTGGSADNASSMPQPLSTQANGDGAVNNNLANEQHGDLSKLLQRFMSVADTVLANHNADRAQIEQAIDFLGDIVKLGPKAPRVYVEMWVSAMRTKAETTANAVKLMDSFAKLLAAGKGT